MDALVMDWYGFKQLSKRRGWGYKYGTRMQTVTELGNEPKAWVDRGFFYGSTLAKHARNPHVDCGYLLP